MPKWMDWLHALSRTPGRESGQRHPEPAALGGVSDLNVLEAAGRRAVETGQLAEAERICRRILDGHPDHPVALGVLGKILLQRNEAGQALPLFSRHDRILHGHAVVTRLLRHQRMDLAKVAAGTPYCREFKDVQIDTYAWSVLDGPDVYSHDTHGKNLAGDPFVQGRVSADESEVIVSYSGPTRRIDQACLLVGGDENYSHWLFRNVLKMSAADRAGTFKTLPWLLNRDLRDHQRQYLELLGIPESQWLLVERNEVIECRHVVVPGLLVTSAMMTSGIEWLHGRLAHCVATQTESTGRIYVSRRDAPKRMVLNEDELLQRLEPLGFELVVPGTCTVAEQMHKFSSATTIVGVHGAGLTNILFCRPNTSVVEINSSALSRMDDFRRMARAAKLRYERVVSADYPPGADPTNPNSDYRVDVNAVLDALRTVTGGGLG